MRILLQDDRTGELEVASAPDPIARSGFVLVQTAFSAISPGTERSTRELARTNLIGKALSRPEEVRKVLDIARREGGGQAVRKVSARLNARRPLGYSASGIVQGVGLGIGDAFRPRQLVACAGAGYANHADVISIPKHLCVQLPSGVSLEDGAFGTVGAIALHAVRQADIGIRDRVVVLGLGLIGQLVAQICRSAGAMVVGIDISERRCALAQDVAGVKAIKRAPDTVDRFQSIAPEGADIVIIAAATRSNDPVSLAAQLCRDRGRVVVIGAVGLDIPREPFYRKELDLRMSRSYGPGRYDPQYEERGHDYPVGYVRWTENRNVAAFLELVGSRQVDVHSLITHRFLLEEAQAAYELLEGKSDAAIGMLFTYPDPEEHRPQLTVQLREYLPTASARVGVGLIGAGHFASGVLLPALMSVSRRRVDLRGVSSASGLTSYAFGKRAGFAFASTDDEVIRDQHTALVIIATRHEAHADLAIRALGEAKAVFVEKPLALSLSDLKRVVEARNGAQTLVAVGFNRRYSVHARHVREHFIGRLEPAILMIRVNAGFVPGTHWTQDASEGGGRVAGEVCHFIDVAAYLVGSPVSGVAARRIAAGARYSGDNVTVTIDFVDGSVATIFYVASGDAGLSKERIEVFAGGRSAVIDNFKQTELYANGSVRRMRTRGQDKGHRSEMQALVDRITGAPSALESFEDAVLTTVATLSVEQSIAECRRVPVGPLDLLPG